MLEKVHIIITLVAALIVTIVCLIIKTEIMDFAVKLCISIIVFYIIGCFIKSYFKKKVFKLYQEYEMENDLPPNDAAEIQKQI